MKIFFVTVYLIFSQNLKAWEIIQENNSLYLSDINLAAKIKVFAWANKTPVEVIPLANHNFINLRYLESQGGTKYLTQTYNCSIFNLSKKSFVAKDLLCKSYSLLIDGKESEVLAKFSFEKHELKYFFEDLSNTFLLHE